MVRRVIEIDREKCNGCGACADACQEGAIGMVDGKAVLLRDGTVYRAQSPQEALDGANIRDIFGVEVGFAPLDGARYIVPRRLERG